jgi:hypothetical protein
MSQMNQSEMNIDYLNKICKFVRSVILDLSTSGDVGYSSKSVEKCNCFKDLAMMIGIDEAIKQTATHFIPKLLEHLSAKSGDEDEDVELNQDAFRMLIKEFGLNGVNSCSIDTWEYFCDEFTEVLQSF